MVYHRMNFFLVMILLLINVNNTAIVKTLTLDDIRKFAQNLLKKGHVFTTIMTSKGQ